MNIKEKLKELAEAVMFAVVLIAIALVFIGIRCDTLNVNFIIIGSCTLIVVGIAYYIRKKHLHKKTQKHL